MTTNCIFYSEREAKPGKPFFIFSVYLGSKANQLYALKIYAQGINKDEAFKR